MTTNQEKRKRKKGKGFFFLLFTFHFLLISISFATDYPYTVTDDLGREVTLEAEPTRVVAMIPSHTETVCAIGACDRLVGIDQYSNFPEEVSELPVLGSAFSPNVEEIVALEPDLVLVDESSELAATLADLGVTVYAGTAQTYEEVFDKFAVTGELLNLEDEAATLSEEVRSEVDGIASLVADAPPVSVYYEIDATPYSVGPESFIGVLLSKAGGANIVEADMGDFPQLDPEFVVAADPAAVILGSASAGESIETLAERPGWGALQAVTSERVLELTEEQDDAASRPGPRIVETVRLFANFLHPELVD